MAEFRQGYLDDYSQNSTGVGIGTSSPVDAKLEIVGGTTTQELNVTGIATFGSASGFIEKHTNYTENVNITNGNSGTLSGEVIVGYGLTMTVGTGATAGQGNIDSLKTSVMFQPPSGTTATRPSGKTGSLFYNFDLKTIEFFDGNTWRQVSNMATSGRGVFFGGANPSPSTVDLSSMEYITIASLGNSVNFGDLTNNPRDPAAFSSSVRGFAAGGDPPPNSSVTDQILYFTIASGGNAIDFGNLTDDRRSCCGNSSSTRGIVAGGYDDQSSANVNIIDYIEMSTVGDALDFGDLTRTERANSGGSNGVRAIYAGGWGSPGTSTVGKDINMLTISSKGNAVKFGELTREKSTHAGGSNSVRCIWAGGYMFFDTSLKEIDYVTIASEGNATNFGELSTRRMSVTDGSAVNSTRFVLGGGSDFYPAGSSNGVLNSMEFITIASTGNAQDFGDLTSGATITNRRACSDSHGGLGGF